jgi:hypothetical protein
VAVEYPHDNYWTSEGIYETFTDFKDMQQYVLGNLNVVSEKPPRTRLNIRFENGPLNSPRQPRLYISALDRKLHLAHAEQGLWHLSNVSALYYSNLNNDPYLDQWIYVEVVDDTQPYTITRQLNVTDTHLIYADDEQGQVLIQEAQVQPSLFETLPPTNHEEWEQLGRQLERYEHERKPGDLRAMIEQVSGATTEIDGAYISDFRFTDTGYRFVIDVPERYRVSGADAAIFENLQPGEYVVSYDDTFQIKPLTPPALSLALHLRNQDADSQRVEPRAVEVINTGLEDAYGLHLRAEARRGLLETEIISQSVTVYGERSQWVSLDWQPVEPGRWEFEAWLEDDNGQVLAQTQQTINTVSWEGEDIQAIVKISSRDEFWWKSPLLLLALGITMIVAAYIAFTETATESDDR